MFSSRQQFLQALKAQRGDESRQDLGADVSGLASGQAVASAVRQSLGIAPQQSPVVHWRVSGQAAASAARQASDIVPQQSRRSAYLQRVSLRGRFLQGVLQRRRQQQRAIDVPKVPPMPKPVGPVDEGPRSVQETFHIAGILVARMSRKLQQHVLHGRLANIAWRVSTTFSGAMMPEIAAKALRKAIAEWSGGQIVPHIEWGHFADSDPDCRQLASQLFGKTRCQFHDVMEWMSDQHCDLAGNPPHEHTMRSKAYCFSHGRMCAVPTIEYVDDVLDVEIAGPPCPPWSKMGKQGGTSDPRFRFHQVWILMVRRRLPGIIIFENVDTYPITLLLQSLGDLYEVRFCKVSPENFGFAMRRLRVYAILTLRSKVRWTTSLPLEHLLNDLSASVVMTGADYFVDQDAGSYRVLLRGERKHLAQYEQLPAAHRLRHAEVWDLHQSTKRATGSVRGGALPTFKRTCGALYLRSRQEFLSPLQALRSMGFPTQEADCCACDMPFVDFDDLCISSAAQCSLAGNAMHMPCVVALLLIAAVYLDKIR